MKNSVSQLIIILLIAFIIFLSILENKKKTKQEVADEYNISKPTLTKWLTFFQPDFNLGDWNKRRKISISEIGAIKSCLGDDVTKVLSKKQIATRLCSDYKTVGANVKMNLDKIGITQDAWEKCSVFPPNISQRILDVLIE